MGKEYEDVLTWHPHLVLISKKPITWRGFLEINNNTQIKINLTVPNYPQMKKASIKFGSKIHSICSSDFSTKVKALLNNATSVLSFLNQLQRIMSNILIEKAKDHNIDTNLYNFERLEELKNTVLIPDITVWVNKDFSVIKLMYKNTAIELKQDSTGNHSWMVVSSDLPKLKHWESLERSVSNLTEAAATLKTRVDALEDTWQNLRIIDENCWVIDPADPKPYHLYRRIHLNAALSLLIKLNPLNPESLPEIKPLGSDKEVAECQNIISENSLNWSDDKTMLDNLYDLLNVSELPQPPNVNEDEKISNTGIVSDEECCICFCLQLDDGEIPSEICNNEKCHRIFHTLCLYQWLAAVAGNRIMFDRIHGNCPNCNENISCHIVNV